MRRVVVTGLGMVSPVGNSVNEAWDSVLAGKTGVDIISSFNSSNISVNIAAEVKNYNPSLAMSQKDVGRNSRFIQFALSAAKEAMDDAGYTSLTKNGAGSDLFGCCIGVGIGGIAETEENAEVMREKGAKRVSPFYIPMLIPNMAVGLVAEQYGLRGPSMCTATACASGTHAIGEGYRYITGGYADVMVCGGTEAAITPLTIAGFASMKALSRRNDAPNRASRPFDLNRDGFVMGEGAGLIILEELDHALARGAKIYAEMVGYGLSSDAYHITSPAPEGEGGQRCMKMALQSARITPDLIDYINAHGTSTKMNDEFESLAITHVFREHSKSLSISSTKGATGHCLGAAGGIEAVFTVKAVASGIVPPTINYETPDPACNLDYTPNEPKKREIRCAMSNSFGFGGINASVLMRRYER